MNISVYEVADGSELWVIVQTDEMVNRSTALDYVDEHHGFLWNSYDRSRTIFSPHLVTPDERAEHGYKFEDRWIFERIN